jgi:hypothetical protein
LLPEEDVDEEREGGCGGEDSVSSSAETGGSSTAPVDDADADAETMEKEDKVLTVRRCLRRLLRLVDRSTPVLLSRYGDDEDVEDVDSVVNEGAGRGSTPLSFASISSSPVCGWSCVYNSWNSATVSLHITFASPTPPS